MAAIPVASQQLEFHKSGADVLIHDVANRKIHVVNEPAMTVLQLCDGRHDETAIAEQLAGKSDDGVLADVRGVIERFRELGLVTYDEENAA